ncbi:MAG TPA: DMT family transporter [Methylomirabilota bacterium]|nr:DMT family transporter [Methylomirabilota bacterium]
MLTWADAGALLAVLVWGMSFPVVKAVMTVMDPVTLMLVRGVIASIVLSALARRAGAWRLPDRADGPALLAAGLVGFTVNQMLYSWGLHLTSASHSGLIFTLTPLFVFGLSHVLGHARMDRLDLLGLALGVAGAILIVGWPAGGGVAGGSSLLGDLLTVGAALTWGVWTILAVPVLRRHGTLVGTAWITVTGTLGLLPFGLPGLILQDWAALPVWAVVGILYAGTAASAGGSLLWYAAVRRLGPARTAIYANMESLFAVLAAVLFLGERVAAASLVGGVAVVVGVLLTRRRP